MERKYVKNVILTASRTGSTIFEHSLNYILSYGKNHAIDAEAELPDKNLIGEHFHQNCNWPIETAKKYITEYPATILKPEAESFRAIIPYINANTHIIWLKRTWDDWAYSFAKFRKTKIHHITSKDSLPSYKSKLKPLTASEILAGAGIISEITKKQERIIANKGPRCMVIYYEDLVRDPNKVLRRSLGFFGLWKDNMELNGIQSPCIKLPNPE